MSIAFNQVPHPPQTTITTTPLLQLLHHNIYYSAGCPAGHVRPSVPVWHSADVLSRRLPSCRWCSWTTTTLHGEPNMRHCPDIQQFWRQSLCSCAHCSNFGHIFLTSPSSTMEQSSIALERGGLTVQSISAVAKEIFVWIVGPRRSVNYLNCAT